MKTLVKRIKATLQADATISSYVQAEAIQIVSADVLPSVSVTLVPFIGVAPVSTSEMWHSSGHKDRIHNVRIFIVQNMEVQETAIVGDSVKKGVLEIVDDVSNAVRAKFFALGGTNYLSKPAEIVGVTFTTAQYGDGVFLFVAQVNLLCVQQIEVTTS
jgi:hypothetical protein